VSSLAAAPRPDAGAAAGGRLAGTRRRLAAHPEPLVTLALAALLVGVAFAGRGGSALGRATLVEVVLILLGAGAVAVAVLVRPPQRRLWGGVTLLLFAALAADTALSTAWSVQPSDSWEAANLVLAYLAAFAGALALAHVAPARWAAVLGAVVLAAVVVSGYALLAKVFPSISPLDTYARLRSPFDYWNAVGLMAALGVPGALWLGARRDGHAALSALAVPALGLLLVALVVILLLAGLGLSFAMSRTALSPQGRRALGTTVLVALALVPLAGIGALAASDRGLTGSISHGWHQLTDPNAQQPGNDPSRFASVGSVRARYWSNGFAIWRKAPWIGVGADGFATARRPIQPDRLRVRHAHGYVPQTLADLGVVGMGINLALLLAWLGAAARATGIRPRRRWGAWLWTLARTRDLRARPDLRDRQPMTPERIGLITLATTAIAFGVHSAVDWTWFVPGTAVAGLLCAAWVAGRGPAGEPPLARVALPRDGAGWARARTRAAIAALVVAAGLAGAWAAWQPQRSAAANDAALAELDAGRLPQALADAERAADLNPLSIDPLTTLATVQSAAHDGAAARATLQRAVRLQPANPDAWLQLGELELAQGRDKPALRLLGAALYLDPHGPGAQAAYAQAAQQAAR